MPCRPPITSQPPSSARKVEKALLWPTKKKKLLCNCNWNHLCIMYSNWEPYPFAHLLTCSRSPCSPYIPWACANGYLSWDGPKRKELRSRHSHLCAPQFLDTMRIPASVARLTKDQDSTIGYSGARHPSFISFMHSSFRLLSLCFSWLLTRLPRFLDLFAHTLQVPEDQARQSSVL